MTDSSAGLDSTMSLIQAAKNMINAVVLTVKTSYVGSRVYRQAGELSTSSTSGQWLVTLELESSRVPVFSVNIEDKVRAC